MMQNKSIKIIGITGGVGTGKSKVLSYLQKECNCKVLKADDIANVLKQPGEDAYDPTVALLGKVILNENGTINNKKMGELIFASPEMLVKVNALIHPMVRKRIMAICEEEKKKKELDVLFIEAALLVETGYGELVDEMWYIFAEDGVRRTRLKENRGYADEKIDGIFASQISKNEFEEVCDFVINNSGLWEDTKKQINHKMEGYSWKRK